MYTVRSGSRSQKVREGGLCPRLAGGAGIPVAGFWVCLAHVCMCTHACMCVARGLLTFRSVGNSSFFTRPVAAAMFPAPENTAPPRCDACSLVFSATGAARGSGKGSGVRVKETQVSPSPCNIPEPAFPVEHPQSLEDILIHHPSLPPSGSRPAFRLGEGKRLSQCWAGT